MGEAMWADVAPEDLGRAQTHECWKSGHRVAPQLAMLWWYLATTTGILVLWAGKGAGLAHGDLEGGIPWNSLTRLNLG